MSGKKKFSEIADEFLDFIKDKKIIIHNAEFDISHLNNELQIAGKNKIDKNDGTTEELPIQQVEGG